MSPPQPTCDASSTNSPQATVKWSDLDAVSPRPPIFGMTRPPIPPVFGHTARYIYGMKPGGDSTIWPNQQPDDMLTYAWSPTHTMEPEPPTRFGNQKPDLLTSASSTTRTMEPEPRTKTRDPPSSFFTPESEPALELSDLFFSYPRPSLFPVYCDWDSEVYAILLALKRLKETYTETREKRDPEDPVVVGRDLPSDEQRPDGATTARAAVQPAVGPSGGNKGVAEPKQRPEAEGRLKKTQSGRITRRYRILKRGATAAAPKKCDAAAPKKCDAAAPKKRDSAAPKKCDAAAPKKRDAVEFAKDVIVAYMTPEEMERTGYRPRCPDDKLWPNVFKNSKGQMERYWIDPLASFRYKNGELMGGRVYEKVPRI